jgi:nitrate reductase gamma subunit
MVEFIKGPLFWISVALFVVGSVVRIVSRIRLAKKDKVVYPYMRWSYSLKSIGHWIVPFGTHSMRQRPFFTVISFAFHICLILTPLLLAAHQQMLGISFLTLPDGVADVMTLVVIGAGLFFLQRRLLYPPVNNVTLIPDYVLLLCVMAPFVTGFLAYHQWFDYRTVLILHMLAGEIMLVIVPFTRISHMLMFPFTRAYMACEFGFVRNSKDW